MALHAMGFATSRSLMGACGEMQPFRRPPKTCGQPFFGTKKKSIRPVLIMGDCRRKSKRKTSTLLPSATKSETAFKSDQQERISLAPFIPETCLVCDSLIRRNSVLFHCECVVVFCQQCALNQVAAQRETYRSGLLCPYCRQSSYNIKNIAQCEATENELIDSAMQHFKIRTSRNDDGVKKALAMMHAGGLKGTITTEDVREAGESNSSPAFKLELARLEALRAIRDLTEQPPKEWNNRNIELPLGPLDLLSFTRNAILEHCLMVQRQNAMLLPGAILDQDASAQSPIETSSSRLQILSEVVVQDSSISAEYHRKERKVPFCRRSKRVRKEQRPYSPPVQQRSPHEKRRFAIPSNVDSVEEYYESEDEPRGMTATDFNTVEESYSIPEEMGGPIVEDVRSNGATSIVKDEIPLNDTKGLKSLSISSVDSDYESSADFSGDEKRYNLHALPKQILTENLSTRSQKKRSMILNKRATAPDDSGETLSDAVIINSIPVGTRVQVRSGGFAGLVCTAIGYTTSQESVRVEHIDQHGNVRRTAVMEKNVKILELPPNSSMKTSPSLPPRHKKPRIDDTIYVNDGGSESEEGLRHQSRPISGNSVKRVPIEDQDGIAAALPSNHSTGVVDRRLYCNCQKPYNGKYIHCRLAIGKCNGLVHPQCCIDLAFKSPNDLCKIDLEGYSCPVCTRLNFKNRRAKVEQANLSGHAANSSTVSSIASNGSSGSHGATSRTATSSASFLRFSDDKNSLSQRNGSNSSSNNSNDFAVRQPQHQSSDFQLTSRMVPMAYQIGPSYVHTPNGIAWPMSFEVAQPRHKNSLTPAERDAEIMRWMVSVSNACPVLVQRSVGCKEIPTKYVYSMLRVSQMLEIDASVYKPQAIELLRRLRLLIQRVHVLDSSSNEFLSKAHDVVKQPEGHFENDSVRRNSMESKLAMLLQHAAKQYKELGLHNAALQMAMRILNWCASVHVHLSCSANDSGDVSGLQHAREERMEADRFLLFQAAELLRAIRQYCSSPPTPLLDTSVPPPVVLTGLEPFCSDLASYWIRKLVEKNRNLIVEPALNEMNYGSEFFTNFEDTPADQNGSADGLRALDQLVASNISTPANVSSSSLPSLFDASFYRSTTGSLDSSVDPSGLLLLAKESSSNRVTLSGVVNSLGKTACDFELQSEETRPDAATEDVAEQQANINSTIATQPSSEL